MDIFPSYFSPAFLYLFAQYMPKKAARSPRQRRAEIRSRAYGSGAESNRRRHRRRISNVIPEEVDVTRSTPKKESKSGKGYNVPQEGKTTFV